MKRNTAVGLFTKPSSFEDESFLSHISKGNTWSNDGLNPASQDKAGFVFSGSDCFRTS